MKYEIHITVHNKHETCFRDYCKTLGIKTIVVVGENLRDVMTSLVAEYANESEAINRAKYLSTEFSNRGFEVQRVKVETPITNSIGIRYNETHIDINYKYVVSHKNISTNSQFYISKNIEKDSTILTIRDTLDKLPHLKRLDHVVQELKRLYGSDAVLKTHSESCIYDSNQAHDDPWINSSPSKYMKYPEVVTRYRTSDNALFDSEEDAIAHEKGIGIRTKIRHLCSITDSSLNSDTLSYFLIENREELIKILS